MRRTPSYTSLWQPIVIVVLFFGAVYYGMMAVNNRDLLWWWPWFEEMPSEIVIYCAGRRTALRPESPDYAPLVQAINDSLSRRVGYLNLGVGEETRREYMTEGAAIEIAYPTLVSVHSQYRLVPFDGLLLPLAGRHSESRVVFFSQEGHYVAGAIQLASIEPIKEALAALGYW